MPTVSHKQYNLAIKADLNARRFVLLEKLNKCEDPDQFLELSQQLDIIDNRLDCIKVRESSENGRDRSEGVRIERSSREIYYGKTCR